MSRFPVSCYPNAGLPDEEGRYLETPESLAPAAGAFSRSRLDQFGGRVLRHHRSAHPGHRADGGGQAAARPLPARSHRSYYSGVELVEADESNRPLIVGERTNMIGSRLFKQLVAAENWEEATEIARRQMKNGAHITDVCLQSADRDEIARYSAVLRRADPQGAERRS